MKIIYQVLAFLFITALARAQDFDWVKTAEGGSHYMSATAPNGTTYVYGDFGGTVTFGSQTFNSTNGGAYLAAYSSSGTLLSAIQLDSVDVSHMHASNTSLYISGRYADGADVGSTNLTGMDAQEGMILQLDPTLNVIMQIKGMNDGSNEWFQGFDVDNAGNIYLANTFHGDSIYIGTSSFTGGTFKEKALFVKFSPTGTILFANVYEMTGNGDIGFYDVEVDEVSGEIFITGSSNNDAIVDSIVFNSSITYKPEPVSDNTFLMRMSSTGNVLDIQDFTDIIQDAILDLELDASGLPYITIGHYVNGYSLLKLNTALDTLWITDAASNGSALQRNDMDVAGDKIYLVGFYDGDADFPGTAFDQPLSMDQVGFLAVYDTAGTLLKVETIQSTDHTNMYGVGVDLAANIYIAGQLQDTAMFDTITVYSPANQAGFLARMTSGVFVGDKKVVNRKDLSLYPNPAREMICINATTEYKTVKIFDVTGKMITEFKPDSTNFKVPVDQLKAGVYLISLVGDGTVVTRRFIKE